MTQMSLPDQVTAITLRCFASVISPSRWADLLTQLRSKLSAEGPSSSESVYGRWSGSHVGDALVPLLLSHDEGVAQEVAAYCAAALQPAHAIASLPDNIVPLLSAQDLGISIADRLIRESSSFSGLLPTLETVAALTGNLLATASHPPAQDISSAEIVAALSGFHTDLLLDMSLRCPATIHLLCRALSARWLPPLLLHGLNALQSPELAQSLAQIAASLQHAAAANPQVALSAAQAISLIHSILSRVGRAGPQTSVAAHDANFAAYTQADIQRVSWKKILKLPASSAALQDYRQEELAALVSVEPEIALVVSKMPDPCLAWQRKVDLVRNITSARIVAAQEDGVSPSDAAASVSYEVMAACVSACTIVESMSPTQDGSQNALASWRTALCSTVPNVLRDVMLSLLPDSPSLDAAATALFAVFEPGFRACEGPEESNEHMDTKEDGAGGAGKKVPWKVPLRAIFLRSLLALELIRQETATSISLERGFDHIFQTLESSMLFSDEAQGSAATEAETKIAAEDPASLLVNVVTNYGSQATFAQTLMRMLIDWIQARDLEHVANWSWALVDHCTALDLILAHTSVVELVDKLAEWFDCGSLNQNGDDTAHVGAIILFTQFLCRRYDIVSTAWPAKALSDVLRSGSAAFTLEALTAPQRGLVDRWITALFGSEGISDDLFSESPPKTLLDLAPTLFSQSFAAADIGVLDLEALRNGFSYFLEDSLSYTLPGALSWLLCEIRKIPCVISSEPTTSDSRGIRVEILGMILASEKCPAAVRSLAAADLADFDLKLVFATDGMEAMTAELKRQLSDLQSDGSRLPKQYILSRLSSTQPSCAETAIEPSCLALLSNLQTAVLTGQPINVRAASASLSVSHLCSTRDTSLTFALAAMQGRAVHPQVVACILCALDLLLAGGSLQEQGSELALLVARLMAQNRHHKLWPQSAVGLLKGISEAQAFARIPKWDTVQQAISLPAVVF